MMADAATHATIAQAQLILHHTESRPAGRAASDEVGHQAVFTPCRQTQPSCAFQTDMAIQGA